MKKYFNIILLLYSFLLFACSNESDYIDLDLNIQLKSKITNTEFEEITNELFDKINNTRSDDEFSLTEEEARLILTPFVEDGKDLQTSMLKQINAVEGNMGLTEDEVNSLTTLDNDDLALFSFVIYELEQCNEISRAALSSQLMSCLSVAVGIPGIRDIWVKGLVDAKTITQVLVAQGKRYLGYLGVALMVYSFVDCVS